MMEYNFSAICDEISGLWDDYISYTPQDQDAQRLIGLPNRYVTPTPAGVGIFDRVQYYCEKYNVAAGKVRKSAVYPTQSGFGWTLGVFPWSRSLCVD
jgi:hypothetical protein